jgi:hypothetical protein
VAAAPVRLALAARLVRLGLAALPLAAVARLALAVVAAAQRLVRRNRAPRAAMSPPT